MKRLMACNPHFKYHPRCLPLCITHLSYADDLLLFTLGDRLSTSLMFECLTRFGDMLGVKVNLEKSNIYLAGMNADEKDCILGSLGISEGVLPFRYLGIPLYSSRLKASDYGVLLDAIRRIIASWPAHTLSYAGKFDLIRSVIQRVECYWLSILPIPEYVVKDIERLCRKFVWPAKRPPIAWDRVCRPKEDGGLGIKDISVWNKALLAKTLWKIHLKKDSLWIKWINEEFSEYGDVWHWVWKKELSKLIKELLSIRDFIVDRVGSVDGAIDEMERWFGPHNGLRKAYAFFIGGNGIWPWKPLVLKSYILPKHKIILWLLSHGKLFTRDRLGFVDKKICPLCKTGEESNAHLFFDCGVLGFLWNRVRDWLGMRKRMTSRHSILQAFRGIYRGSSMMARMRVVALAACIYQVWTARNRASFEDIDPVMDEMFSRVPILVFRCIPSVPEISLT
ncbi:uncharacterized protein [Henckelia pumila]|uniref:uncharacterized protein n=1 Tax=Henckelia pumila TaxID=405737 RepID=UPI003C6E58D1